MNTTFNTYRELAQLAGSTNNSTTCETLVNNTATILNQNMTWETLEKLLNIIKETFRNHENSQTCKQLYSILDQLRINHDELKIRVYPNFLKSIDIALLQKFTIKKVALAIHPETDAEQQDWSKACMHLLFAEEIDLDPDCADYKDTILIPLANMTALKTLKIGHWIHLNGSPMLNLRLLTQLKHLDFDTQMTDQVTSNLVPLKLETLSISHSCISTEGFANICQVTTLTSLRMMMENLHGDYQAISNLRNLRAFNNWCNTPDEASMKELAKCPLEFLSLSRCFSTNAIQAIFTMTTLRMLKLHDIEQTDTDFSGLSNLRQLEAIDLEGKHLSGEFLRYLAGLPLTMLKFRYNSRFQINYEYFKAMTQLSYLDLPDSPSRADIAILAKLPLTEVELDGSNFDEHAMLTLSEHCTTLESLSVKHAIISDNGLIHLQKLPKLHTLDLGFAKRLSFDGIVKVLPTLNNLRNVGFRHVLTSKQLEELRKVAPQIQSTEWLFWGFSKMPGL